MIALSESQDNRRNMMIEEELEQESELIIFKLTDLDLSLTF